ncbi:unnamed protein product, partial [marine sediment metagenome]
MAGETDKPDLANLPCFNCLLYRTFGEDPVRLSLMDDFVELEQVDLVGLKSSETLIQLLPKRYSVTSVVFGHEEDLLSVTILESASHNLLTSAV